MSARGNGSKDACQLCPITWDGKARPLAVTKVAGLGICERHAELVKAIAADAQRPARKVA